MREGGRVDDDAGGRVPRLVDPVDDLVLGVALQETDLQAVLPGDPAAVTLHVRERFAAVDLRLALAEQVQVRAVQHVDGLGHDIAFQSGVGSSPARAGLRFGVTAR